MEHIHIETWAEFKTLLANKNAKIQYVMKTGADKVYYEVFFIDGGIKWIFEIEKIDPTPEGSDQEDFETNYQATANQSIDARDLNGRIEVTRTSRPEGTLTYFGGAGDSGTQIGDGKMINWDFSNTDDEVSAPTGYKRKRIEISYLDEVWLKEGIIFFQAKAFGSYADFYVVCPAGEYYLDNNKVPQLAGSDTIVEHYIAKMPMVGSAQMGVELNTESAQAVGMPTNYKIWVEITVPDTDTQSKGGGLLEMYRTRNHVL